MSENTEKIISLINRAAELTGVNLLAPEKLTSELPIQVSLIGQPQQNLFGILEELGEYTAALNRPMYRSFCCTISYGEEKTLASQNGEMAEISTGELAQLLQQFDSAAEPLQCEIHLPQEALKNVNLQLIASAKDFSDVDWDRVLMGSDYCYFTLTVTALLAMAERKALRNYLLAEMPQQLGILTTNDHLILSSDRADIDNSLNRFFKGQVPIFTAGQEDFSMLGACAELASDVQNLRQSRSSRAEQLCLKKAIHQLELQLQVFSEDSEELEDALAILEEKARDLPSHMKTASRRARMQYTSQMKLEITEQASNFYHALKEQLQKEISGRKDIEQLQDVIPRYINSQWESCVAQIQSSIDQQVAAMQKSLDAYIEKDIRSYIENGVDMAMADYIFCLTNVYGKNRINTQGVTFAFEEKHNDLKYLFSSKESTLMAAAVGILLLNHPLLGAGAALLGMNKQKKRLLADNQQGLIEAADKMSKEIYDQVVIHLDGVIKTLENNLNTAVETCYQKIMDTMVQALTDRKRDQNSYADKIGKLSAMKSEMAALIP